MKFRKDFVTNSSSSSFIFGRVDENVTKDMVYCMIRDIYKDYILKFESVKQNAYSYGLVFKNGCFESIDINKDEYDILKLLGLHFLDRDISFGLDSLSAETYQEYLEKSKDGLLFEILEFDDSIDKYVYEEIMNWYIGCSEELLNPIEEEWWKVYDLEDITKEQLEDEDSDIPCHHCYFRYNDENCKKFRNGVKELKIDYNNVVPIMLGKYFLWGYEGLIPPSIVEELYKITDFGCNHMG